ncbi:MAG: hypothetical protein ABIA92_02465 [Patescibacteria group bacterium]
MMASLPSQAARTMRCVIRMTLVIVLFALSISAFADDTAVDSLCKGGEDEAVEAILNSVTPVSAHFTQKVLDRAEKGIEEAFSHTQTFNDKDFMSWAEHTFQAFSAIIDTKLRLIYQERDLRENTSCLHIDLLLIETMMEKVRCKIQFAFEKKQHVTILQLKDIIIFLNESYNDLSEGARHNAYVASGYPQSRSFDADPAWCCRDGKMCELFYEPGECGGNKEETVYSCMIETDCGSMKLCPFHSDYLPPSSFGSGGTVFGYGCDLGIISRYSSISAPDSKIGDAINAEVKAMRELINERDKFITDSMHLKEDATNLDLWMGRAPSPRLEYFGMTVDSQREHYTVFGCSESPYAWSAPISDEEEEEGTDRTPDSLWPPIWPAGAIRWPTYGAFSFNRNELQLMKEYRKLREEWGKRRPLAYELPDQFGFYFFLQLYFRGQFKLWDIYQERLTSTIVAHATDVPRRIIAELTPLREAVGEFSTYASVLPAADSGAEAKGGIRGFARGLAYFLRRSCITRPCNERLERILRVVLQDKCFPYTGGNYSGKVWEDCKKAAELDEFAP